MMLSDWIAVMNDGEVEQFGRPDEVYHEPNNEFVATFVGMPEMNVWEGETDGDTCTVTIGDQRIAFAVRDEASRAERKSKRGIADRSSDAVRVGFRPQAMTLVAAGEGDLDATLALIEPRGENSLCYLDSPVGEIRVVESDPSNLAADSTVGVQLDRQAGYVFDVDTGSTIARTGTDRSAQADDATTNPGETPSDG